ncbi:MAG: hypothetical protein NZ926_02630 [Candidatus Methanomethylicia archaeon]|nr:hypothetical protein [Candidatus Methanomethylicia archaeon]MCX8169191.1 hypothetical protein [Candidatus Methanomethylicia archaeon]MDW7989027.1 hypothetical protein [Nitrososphaerota archaeon]
MKSYIKLYGPSIDKGLEALDNLMRQLAKTYPYGEAIQQIISILDPNIDIKTGKSIRGGTKIIGDYDYVIEWTNIPTIEQLRSLIRKIDDALMYTGCKYTITTKE